MTTAARPGQFTGATDNAANGGLFTDTKIDGIPDLVAADVLSAQNSATTATTQAATATTQATTATTKAAEAAASATAAASSATSASSSATTASSGATTATTKASEASTSATNAATSETNAATSATNAAASASTASTQATSATTQANSALSSASSATTSATTATNYATKVNGAITGTDFSSKAWSIGGTGVTDTAGRGAAKEWATEAEDNTVDGTNYSAKHHALKAAASATAAAASYDSFDDRYLGAKSSNPTVDNDGATLLDGALYFNTSDNRMLVYDLGNTTWQILTPTSTEQGHINTVSGIQANVTTVAGIASNVTSVAGNTTNINAVAGDATDIGTVAGSISNVNTVAAANTNISNLNATGVLDNIETVADDITNVNTVASNVTGVNSFASRYRVASSAPSSSLDEGDLYFDTNLNELKAYNGSAWQSTAPSASNQTNINICAGEITAQEDLGSITSAVATSSGNNINTVGSAISNVNTVAGISSNVTTVAGISANVTTVAGIASNVTTVANNVAGVNSFAERYRVSSSVLSSSLDEGDLYYNTSTNTLNYYNGSSWVAVVAGAMTSLAVDSTPQLGGDLDVNGNDIVSANNGHITIDPHGSGEIKLNGTVNTTNLTMDFGSIA